MNNCLGIGLACTALVSLRTLRFKVNLFVPRQTDLAPCVLYWPHSYWPNLKMTPDWAEIRSDVRWPPHPSSGHIPLIRPRHHAPQIPVKQFFLLFFLCVLWACAGTWFVDKSGINPARRKDLAVAANTGEHKGDVGLAQLAANQQCARQENRGASLLSATGLSLPSRKVLMWGLKIEPRTLRVKKLTCRKNKSFHLL